jgi:hypothetical protein
MCVPTEAEKCNYLRVAKPNVLTKRKTPPLFQFALFPNSEQQLFLFLCSTRAGLRGGRAGQLPGTPTYKDHPAKSTVNKYINNAGLKGRQPVFPGALTRLGLAACSTTCFFAYYQ